MITDYIVDFSSYLNAHDDGFAIMSDKIKRFFEIMADDDLDFTNTDDVLGIMKAVFCSNYQQYILIDDYFKSYWYDKQNYESISLLTKQKQHWQDQYDVCYKSYHNYLETLNHLQQLMANELKAIEKEIYEHQDKYIDIQMPPIKPIKFTKKEQSLIDKILDNNQSYEFSLSICEKEMMIDIFKEYNESILYECDESLFKNIKMNIVKLSEEALENNDLELFDKMNNFFKLIDKLIKQKHFQNHLDIKYNEDIQNHLDLIIREKQKDVRLNYDKQIEIYHNQLKELKKKHELIQNRLKEINEQINYKNHMIIEKDQSLCHRDEFIGKNSVQAYDCTIDHMQDILDKKFNTLSENEKEDIYYFIKKNVVNFKTRFSRHIQTNEIRKIDMQTTIQHALKTGGLPLEISYLKPKANKTNIILILDVSGSCKDASQMMLTFMYILKSIFPRGCQTFAFVDSLFDISTIMDSDNIATSIEKTLNLIPRHGVYSNYFVPFNSIWNEHRQIFTSDSIVIVIGDARNNHNPTGEEIMKNIARRVKKAYWLNTESYNKWNTADSLASLYGKYFNMHEMLNAKDLIQFIQNLI
ncbi:MAG: VWA domain-containing protein [Erysipelotrichaceae bacterium]|nr:VWA domain-containing protein [Erysipelotrichaceae bacterium]